MVPGSLPKRLGTGVSDAKVSSWAERGGASDSERGGGQEGGRSETCHGIVEAGEQERCWRARACLVRLTQVHSAEFEVEL